MKRTIAAVLALVLSCSVFAACSGKDNSSSTPDSSNIIVTDDSSVLGNSDPSSDDDPIGDSSSEDESSSYISITLENETPKETDERLYKDLMSRIEESGVYTISASVDGLSVYITTDGESTYTDFLGIAILSNADGDYMIDTEGKRYYLDDSEESMEADMLDEKMLSIFTGTEGMTYVSTSTAQIIGKEYTVEKYINDETGYSFSYVFDAGGDLAFVGDGELFISLDFIDRADASKLSLEGYTEMTQEEYLAWYFGE